jgi:hypothetical protein
VPRTESVRRRYNSVAHIEPLRIGLQTTKPSMRPTEGGQSPIVDCRKIYAGMDPQLRTQFETTGAKYVKNMHGQEEFRNVPFFSSPPPAGKLSPAIGDYRVALN